MRIALIHSHLDSRGGSQRYVIEIALTLKSLGVDVDIFSYEFNKNQCYSELTSSLNIKNIINRELIRKRNSKKKKFKKFFEKILKNHFLKNLANFFGIDYLVHLYFCNKQAIKLTNLMLAGNKAYDLIFAHEEPISIYSAIKYKIIKNTPVYWFCYDSIEKWFIDWKTQKNYYFIRNFLLKKIYFKYDYYLIKKFVNHSAVLDNSMKKKFQNLYDITPNIRRGGINNLVLEYEKKEFLRKKYKLSKDIKIIFILTRFVPQKRVHDIFKLYEILSKHEKNKFFIYLNSPVIDKKYYDWCIIKYSKILNNHNIILDLQIPRNDNEMYNLYLSSDIFIFPSQNQTWGHAALEAMACGLTTVVSNSCGISEVVKGITPGMVYSCGNMDELAKIITNIFKGDYSNKIGRKQKKFVKNNLTWEKVCHQYISDFKKFYIN